MKYKIKTTTNFERSASRLTKGDRNKVWEVIKMIANGDTLPPNYRDHPLKGNKKDMRDCHVKPDFVLIYKLEHDIMVLTAVNVGSHSNVFHG